MWKQESADSSEFDWHYRTPKGVFDIAGCVLSEKAVIVNHKKILPF